MQYSLISLRNVFNPVKDDSRSKHRQAEPLWSIDRQEILDDLYYRGGR